MAHRSAAGPTGGADEAGVEERGDKPRDRVGVEGDIRKLHKILVVG